MSIRRRIEAAERVLGVRVAVQRFVVWTGTNEDECRAQVEDAQRNGWDLTVVRICAMRVAETMEEAQAMVEEHRKTSRAKLTVYRKGTHPPEAMLTWDGGEPEWLKGAS